MFDRVLRKVGIEHATAGDLLDDFKDHALAVPYHPQCQFLKDVDDDGEIDHLYCCEAAALEYYNYVKKGSAIDPITFEKDDTLVEYREVAGGGPDAGWGAALIGLLIDFPTVYGPRAAVSEFARFYRVPVEHVDLNTQLKIVNHDLLVVGHDHDYLYLHCTYHGPCKVSRSNFNDSTLMLATTAYHDPPSDKLTPFDAAVHVLEETDAPVIATVNALKLNPAAKLGAVPFIIAVEDDFRPDWREGLSDNLPDNKADLTCYYAALFMKDELPIYSARNDGPWLNWLKNHERDLLGD